MVVFETNFSNDVSVKALNLDSDFTLLLPLHSNQKKIVYEIRKMEPAGWRIRNVSLFCLFLAVAGIIGFGYFCDSKVCALTRKNGPYSTTDIIQPQISKEALVPNIFNPGLSYEEVLHDDFQFDMNAHDVMVYLHIQKTGGTSFGKHLVRDLDLKRPCTCQRRKKRCYCFRPHRNENWLFSRYSTGWKCGLHADWTELTGCVDQELDRNEGETAKRRYFYITLLREPKSRFLSEWRHVQRGATWKNARHWCLGKEATVEELPACYKGDDWRGVTLEEFTSCSNNLAINRQTRMISDLALIGCYNKSTMLPTERNRVMLASAKRNLAAMSYFGLTEYQKISQYIFEETFNLRFAIPFEQHNTTVSINTLNSLTVRQLERDRKSVV